MSKVENFPLEEPDFPVTVNQLLYLRNRFKIEWLLGECVISSRTKVDEDGKTIVFQYPKLDAFSDVCGWFKQLGKPIPPRVWEIWGKRDGD